MGFDDPSLFLIDVTKRRDGATINVDRTSYRIMVPQPHILTAQNPHIVHAVLDNQILSKCFEQLRGALPQTPINNHLTHRYEYQQRR